MLHYNDNTHGLAYTEPAHALHERCAASSLRRSTALMVCSVYHKRGGLFGAASAGDFALFCGGQIVEDAGVATPSTIFCNRSKTCTREAKKKRALRVTIPTHVLYVTEQRQQKSSEASRRLYPLRFQGEQHA